MVVALGGFLLASFKSLREDMNAGIKGLREDMNAGIKGLREDMNAGIKGLREDIPVPAITGLPNAICGLIWLILGSVGVFFLTKGNSWRGPRGSMSIRLKEGRKNWPERILSAQ